jgi:hypothetical protein
MSPQEYVEQAYRDGAIDESFGEQSYDNAKDFFKFSNPEKKECPELKGIFGACRNAYDSGNVTYDFFTTGKEYREALKDAREEDEVAYDKSLKRCFPN